MALRPLKLFNSKLVMIFLFFIIFAFSRISATPFGYNFGTTFKEMQIDTSYISNFSIEKYIDFNKRPNEAFTIWVKPEHVPDPCPGIDDYLIEFDAFKRPYQFYGRTKKSLAKADCFQIKKTIKDWIEKRYPTVVPTEDSKLSNFIQYEYDSEKSYTVDLYCTDDGTPVIKYTDHGLYAAFEIAKKGLFLDTLDRGLSGAIQAFQTNELNAKDCKNWVFMAIDRDEQLRAIQILKSFVIYQTNLSIPIMIKKQIGEMPIQGQFLKGGYYIFKGFQNYTNVLGASAQAVLFEYFPF